MLCKIWRDTEASSIIELAIVMPFLTLLIAGIIDFGRAYYLAIEIVSAAHAAAVYGSQNPTDSLGMTQAARLSANDVPNLTTLATYGCECSDGAVVACSSSNPCTYNMLQYVQISTSAVYRPLLPYPGFPSTVTLHGAARMRAGL